MDFVHPGEVLSEEFLKPLGISQYRVAKDIGVPATRIGEIILGKRGITANTALHLAAYLSTTAEFWVNLQTHFNLNTQRIVIADKLGRLTTRSL